ncbi:serine hydrolase domain-containing protein [Paenibacillus chitinolyticus]|uniref:serine hydrolase domain-containing protein n=1 Tax=Paenibacillus chitinolyticus TaxID=79263 RepID=UPI001C476AF8|nr:serine hydrolase domain-containing protein [Paenibacillus chitinolyticus]MBV6712524.1 beta-lactamase family protein [Paenibacillus chitinolyticus]
MDNEQSLELHRSDAFSPLNQYVLEVKEKIEASAAAVYILHRGTVVNEWYSGTHGFSPGSRAVGADSRFNVASVRKTYLGFAVSLAIYEGRIGGLDDPVSDYMADPDGALLAGTTIRHLLTHTHGLASPQKRIFPPGADWAYNNVGVNLLIRMIGEVFGKPLAQLLNEKVFRPGGFTETGWSKHKTDGLVWLNEAYSSDEGTDINMFVSARELAFWGQLHLSKGMWNGMQLVPRPVWEQTAEIISPEGLGEALPRNGFFWFVQDRPRSLTELGHELPAGSYQSLGSTGCACLVIPEKEAVAVRMYNQTGPNPGGYNYLDDIRTFGNTVYDCLNGIGLQADRSP